MKKIAVLYILILALCTAVAAQRIAVLTPDGSETSRDLANDLATGLKEMKVIDSSIAESAFLAVSPPTPFNLSTADAKRIGILIGCDAFIITRAATQRRSAFDRADYFETYAAIFVVSSRTGRLIFWKLQKAESVNASTSRKMFDPSLPALAAEIRDAVRASIQKEITEAAPPAFDEPPDEKSPTAKGLRSPVPYRRLKPEYTAEASLYDVKATVDLMVYLDAAGNIVRTDIERWAGFGLDASVERNVRTMNWRPAERDGKPMAMKFLVRYNFKKAE